MPANMSRDSGSAVGRTHFQDLLLPEQRAKSTRGFPVPYTHTNSDKPQSLRSLVCGSCSATLHWIGLAACKGRLTQSLLIFLSFFVCCVKCGYTAAWYACRSTFRHPLAELPVIGAKVMDVLEYYWQLSTSCTPVYIQFITQLCSTFGKSSE